jgi:hypothetical protein
MADNVNIIVQDTINDIVVNAAVVVETIDINVQAAVDRVDIVANPNNYVVNINRIIGEQVQSDWDQADNQAPDYIKNKPTIPTATSDLTNDGEDGINPFITAADVTPQVNSDWDATSGVAEILNKPTIPAAVTKTSDLTNDGENGVDPFITAADIPPVTGFVPYTGATDDVDLGEFEIKAGQVEFDQTPTGTAGVGIMRWNDSDGTVDLGLKGGNVTLQIGQEQVLRVVNKTATNVNLLEANYQAVRVTGAQGQRLKVDLAQAINDTLSAETIGLVTETINNNQEGFITTSGLVRGINTTGSLQGETWADGDILYLSPTTAGNATKVKPVAPNHLIILGYVIRAHITQGSIFVKVDNGYEISELHDVKITTPENRDLLAYDSSDSIWKNSSFYNRSLGGVQYFNDFDSSVNFYNLVSLTGGTAAATQRLTNFVPNQTANQIGIAHYQTGTLATGWAMHITEQSANGQQFQFGGGNWMYESYIEVNTLSDATNRFRFISGFGNVASSGTETNGAFFTYDEGGVSNGTIASPNWQCVTTVGAIRTLTTTSVAVTTTWTKLRIIVNADATEVKFYIDGTLVATHITNIPVLPNRFKVKQMIAKSLGTGNRFVFCDYIFYENNLTTLR